jgi:hypothetical protein
MFYVCFLSCMCLTTQFLRVWFTDRIVPVENCTRHSFIWQSLFIDLWQVGGFHQSYSPTIMVKPRYYLKWKGSLVMVNNSTNNKTNNYNTSSSELLNPTLLVSLHILVVEHLLWCIFAVQNRNVVKPVHELTSIKGVLQGHFFFIPKVTF